jgi:hypothetical protein
VTLISSIITDAYRESNILPIGVAPNDAQLAEALRLYNAILSSLFGEDVGELLADWPLGDLGRDASEPNFVAYSSFRGLPYPPINSRLIALNTTPLTVDLTDLPQEGARYAILDPFGNLANNPVTLNANGRYIAGEPTLVLATAGLAEEWFYRADLASWMQITNKAATDENPFPQNFDAMFIVLLAIRLNPRYGRQLADMSASVLKQGRTAFVARYLNAENQTRLSDLSWPFMSRQSYGTGRSRFSSTPAFNRGSVRDA